MQEASEKLVYGEEVFRKQTKSGFKQRVYIMYHSTKTPEAAKSILENGFRKSDPACNMLGAGIYASRALEKARSYGDITFKLLVYPGLIRVITKQGDPKQKKWQGEYGSAWVPPKCGMVRSGLAVSSC